MGTDSNYGWWKYSDSLYKLGISGSSHKEDWQGKGKRTEDAEKRHAEYKQRLNSQDQRAEWDGWLRIRVKSSKWEVQTQTWLSAVTDGSPKDLSLKRVLLPRTELCLGGHEQNGSYLIHDWTWKTEWGQAERKQNPNRKRTRGRRTAADV